MVHRGPRIMYLLLNETLCLRSLGNQWNPPPASVEPAAGGTGGHLKERLYVLALNMALDADTLSRLTPNYGIPELSIKSLDVFIFSNKQF